MGKTVKPRVWPWLILTTIALAAAGFLYLNALMLGSFSIAHDEPAFLAIGRNRATWAIVILAVGLASAVVGFVRRRQSQRLP
jgi:hypothetical protein